MKIYRAIVFSAGPEGIYVRVPNLYDTIYGPLECISSDPLISPIYKKGDSVVIQQVSNDADDYMVVGYRTIGSKGSQLPVEWDGILNKPFTFQPSAHTHLWSEIVGRPSSFPPALHSHTWTEILSKPTTFPPATHSHAWADITSKPTTFTPTSHTHDWGEVTGKPSFLQLGTTATTAAAGNHSHSWGAITGKPTTFPPSTHAHAWADITSKPATFTPSAHTHEGDNLTPNSVVSTRAVNVGGSGQNEIMMYPTGMNQTINGISVPVMAEKGFVPAIHNHNGDTLLPNKVLIEGGQSTDYFKLEVRKEGISQSAYGIASPVMNPSGLGFVPASHVHNHWDFSDIPRLTATTNLNNVTIQGIWMQGMTSDASLARNYPIVASGMLEVFYSGTAVVFQRYTTLSPTGVSPVPRVFNRSRLNNVWSEWIESPNLNYVDDATADIRNATYLPTGNTLARRHSNGTLHVTTGTSANDAANKGYVDEYKLLWGVGATYMNGDQTVTLSENITAQKTGIVLCWSAYESGAGANNSWSYQFVPKWHVIHAPGTGVYTIMERSGGTQMQKYVYVSNKSISGNNSNTTAPNNTRVLRAVLGV